MMTSKFSVSTPHSLEIRFCCLLPHTHRVYWPWRRQIQQRTLVYYPVLLLFWGGGRCVLTSKLHTSAKTLQQDQFILCAAKCVREKICETHTHTQTQTVKKNSWLNITGKQINDLAALNISLRSAEALYFFFPLTEHHWRENKRCYSKMCVCLYKTCHHNASLLWMVSSDLLWLLTCPIQKSLIHLMN